MQLQEFNFQQGQSFSFSGPELEQVRDHIHQVAGVYYSEQFFPLLLDRCQQRMSTLNKASLQHYLEFLRSSQEELKELLNEITLGDACFYENPPQMSAFLSVALPNVLKHKAENSPVRIWSAGCSSGEQPYSLAMLLMEQGAELLKGREYEIIATDPNEHAIEKCRQGIYGRYTLRNLPNALLAKHFIRKDDGIYQVNDDMKAKIKFQQINLLDDSKLVFLKGIDVIFCRNVLTYFSLESKLHVLRHFYCNLHAYGYLFLGYPETLFGVTDDFQLVHFNGATGYIKKPTIK
ncbi:MAG TPA: CheR family methyltransferase [Candidatus Angelobacter sp.]|nr:CheR family methyltransferase [Candidatus Angelobacter sp.]